MYGIVGIDETLTGGNAPVGKSLIQRCDGVLIDQVKNAGPPPFDDRLYYQSTLIDNQPSINSPPYSEASTGAPYSVGDVRGQGVRLVLGSGATVSDKTRAEITRCVATEAFFCFCGHIRTSTHAHTFPSLIQTALRRRHRPKVHRPAHLRAAACVSRRVRPGVRQRLLDILLDAGALGSRWRRIHLERTVLPRQLCGRSVEAGRLF